MGLPRACAQRQASGMCARTAAHLMRAADEIEVVLLQELGHHVGPKRVAHAAVVLAPTLPGAGAAGAGSAARTPSTHV